METSKRSRTEVSPGVWIDSRRALFIEPLQLLVLADIHWGYSTSHRAVGNLLPIWGDQQIETSHLELIRAYQPKEVIWLGDCLHAVSGRAPAEDFLRRRLADGLQIHVLRGNHDRHWKITSERTLQRGNFFFHHGDDAPQVPKDAIEVVGHFHPAFNAYDGAGTRLRIPALVQSSKRLILPAFSPWAGGVPWNQRLQPEENLWAIAPSRIFAVRLPRNQASTATK
jgi:uncharacterized protein